MHRRVSSGAQSLILRPLATTVLYHTRDFLSGRCLPRAWLLWAVVQVVYFPAPEWRYLRLCGRSHPPGPYTPDVELDWREVDLLHADSVTPSLVGTSPGHINSHSVWLEVRPGPRMQRRCCGASKDSESKSKCRAFWGLGRGAGAQNQAPCWQDESWVRSRLHPMYGTRQGRHIKKLRSSLERKQEDGLAWLVAGVQC